MAPAATPKSQALLHRLGQLRFVVIKYCSCCSGDRCPEASLCNAPAAASPICSSCFEPLRQPLAQHACSPALHLLLCCLRVDGLDVSIRDEDLRRHILECFSGAAAAAL
jgi:hypothetical protein